MRIFKYLFVVVFFNIASAQAANETLGEVVELFQRNDVPRSIKIMTEDFLENDFMCDIFFVEDGRNLRKRKDRSGSLSFEKIGLIKTDTESENFNAIEYQFKSTLSHFWSELTFLLRAAKDGVNDPPEMISAQKKWTNSIGSLEFRRIDTRRMVGEISFSGSLGRNRSVLHSQSIEDSRAFHYFLCEKK